MKRTLFAILLAPIFLTACAGQQDAEPEITNPVVQILDLSEKPTYQISEVGQIKAVQEIELVAKGTGTIGELNGRVGDPVVAGQVLAVIDFDEVNNPAQVNFDNAQIQLSNAQQNYDQRRANDADAITRANLRAQSLEKALGRLQRNLEELLVTNNSTRMTLELQLENAEKNADTAQVNYDNIVAQFDQSWLDLLASTTTSLNSVFIDLDTHFLLLEDIINPSNFEHFNSSTIAKGLGSANSIQRNQVISTYDRLRDDLQFYRRNFESYLPLTDSNLSLAVAEARKAVDDMRLFASAVRTMLYNSVTTSSLTETILDGYITQTSTSEGVVIADAAVVDGLEQAVAAFKLDRTSQTATADNNRIIASNQLAEASNALLQFQTTSIGGVQDLEVQIEQTQNDLLSSQADLASARRSFGISSNSQQLELGTLENQLRLAEKSLTDNQVTSSIDGVLSEFVVDEGDYVTLGTFLGRVIQHEQVKVVFFVSKENASRLNLGQPFNFTVDGEGEEMLGIVNKISPSADPISKKIRIEGSIQNEDFVLKPETYISLKLDISTETFDLTKIYVPMNSIIFAQNAQYVYLLEDDLAVRKDIEIGEVFGAWVEVTEGLDKSDLLIIDGQRNLPPAGGVPVDLLN